MPLRYLILFPLLLLGAALSAQRPVAVCEDGLEVSVGNDCLGHLTPEIIDAGSYTFTGTMRLLINKRQLPLGTHVVTLKVNDGRYSSGCETEVRVVDKISPEVVCYNSVDIVLDNPTQLPSIITVADVAANISDNCNWTATVDVSGLTYFGSTTYMLTVTDDGGNESNCWGYVNLRSPHIGNSGYCGAQGDTRYEYIDRFAWRGNTSWGINSGDNGGSVFFVSTRHAYEYEQVEISYAPGYTGSPYREYWSVYIDANRDGDFTDAGELLDRWNGTGGSSAQVTLPYFPYEGYSRVRVVMSYGHYADPCSTTFEGEQEDYVVYLNWASSSPLAATDGLQLEETAVAQETGKAGQKRQPVVRLPRTVEQDHRVFPTAVSAGGQLNVRLSLVVEGKISGRSAQVQGLVLRNMQGQVVAEFAAADGAVVVPASLPSGVYVLGAWDQRGGLVWQERIVVGR